MGDSLQRVGQRRRPGIDDVLARDDNGGLRGRRQLRLPPPQLGRVDEMHVVEAVAVRVFHDVRQLGRLCLVPGDEQAAGLEQGQIQMAVDLPIFGIAGAHAGELQGVERAVVAGVQHGAVALAGPGQDVGALLDEDSLGAAEGEAPEDGAADDAGADDGDVIAHDRSIAMAAQRCRTTGRGTRKKRGATLR